MINEGAVTVFLSCAMLSMTAALPTTSTSTTSASPASSPPSPQKINIYSAAFFTCGDEMYPQHSLSMLFPPSDRTVDIIDNITKAAAMQNESMSAFCGERQKYVQCVQSKLRKPTLLVDKLVSAFIDVDTFGKAFELYCNNSDLIASQFECTLNSTATSPCHYGGVSGMIAQVYAAMLDVKYRQQYCANADLFIQCRVQCQLQKCDTDYARVMEDVYHFLIGNNCSLQKSTLNKLNATCPRA